MSGAAAPHLVVTAPGDAGQALISRLGCRTTVGVLVQLIAEAKREVMLGAPFLQGGPELGHSSSLQLAIEAALHRGVHFDFISTRDGLDSAAAAMAAAPRPYIRFLQPSANLADHGQLGMHAKFCVADRSRAYVGSANVTGPGLSEHIEMGLLVEGPTAAQIWMFWQYALEGVS